MSVRVVVREFMSRLLLAVPPSTDAGLFERGPLKGRMVARKQLRASEAKQIPEGWLIYRYDPIKRWDLMDYLVLHFDADVDWPDYQWGLDNLRKRRDRLNQPPAHESNSASERIPRSPRRQSTYPKAVVAAYQTLQCPLGADLRAVQKAYRDRSRICHPDRGGSAEQMSLVNRAVGVLRAFLQSTQQRTADR